MPGGAQCAAVEARERNAHSNRRRPHTVPALSPTVDQSHVSADAKIDDAGDVP
jgi:hypothetical protein